ncbi:glycosyltransferase family 2 protein [Phycisphaera mikurensis]|uniref:glycosyltransferase family 2 protein n=1 Tax=Phycisphaera mikurensis TaxID=547188 RepID=UPI001461507F|nr:glycosyltransferase family 2 protein [Phycisphaera mikurensis]MBB6441771.1 glycosyltransferase involved in cell wall biosynthesis [Phycisphaera mikurensis]
MSLHRPLAPDSSAGTYPDRGVVPVSVVLLTHNEAGTLPAALASCRWCDDVAVVDSGSTDETRSLAEATGARVFTNPFESFGRQRNWAIDHAEPRHKWVFHLDADEEFTPALVEEIRRFVASPDADTVDGLHVAHKLMLHRQWLRYAGGYPVFQMRFFHADRMRFIDHGHGQRERPGGRIGRLGEPYLHHAFAKGMEAWLAKHNGYARREAEQARRAVEGEAAGLAALLSSDGVRRRRAVKSLFQRLPARPTLRWLIVLVLQRGVFDGRAGWTYASMLRVYEQMILLHARALADGEGTSPPPDDATAGADS